MKKYLHSDIEEYKKLDEKPILYVKNLTKKYFGRKKPAISNISFNVYPGEFHAFIGANGAGKTTTIKSIIGAYCNWSGTILINGIENNKSESKKKIGYIPENTRFPAKFSTYSYLIWMIMLSGFSRKEAKVLAKQKLEEFNLWNLRKKSPNDFSSGQKKKVLLAQALIHNPDVIIMDEPVANLDPKARADFFQILMGLKKQNKSIFISSHVLAELQVYFDSATILDGGEIKFSGKRAELLSKFVETNYSISTNNNDKIKKYLDSVNIKHISDEYDSDIIIFYTDNKNGEIEKLEKYIFTNKITILKLVMNEPTLDEVYRKLIVKGSVDTMDKEQSLPNQQTNTPTNEPTIPVNTTPFVSSTSQTSPTNTTDTNHK